MEKSKKWYAIVNPVAGNGRGLADWPQISKLMRDDGIIPDYAFTDYRYHAIELAVEAVAQGYRKLLVIGGDGTLHEVINGLFIQELVPTTEIVIGVIATGTGNNWLRMFGTARNYREAVRAVAEGHSILQDVGKASYHKANYKQSRYMVNTAGIGLDAYIVRKYSRNKKAGVTGKLLYMWTTVKSVFRYRSTGVKIWLDEELIVNDFVYSATIGIGRYSRDGRQSAPHAILDDGLFDITVIRRINKLGAIKRFKSLYNGSIYDLRQASHHRGRNIRIESTPETGLEIDGEPLGYTPFEFCIIDRAINMIALPDFSGQGEND